MRRPLTATSLAALAFVAAACTASAAPAWTYAPPTPSPTPGPSASGSASAAPSAAASAGPSAAASAPSGSAAAGTTIQISALNIAFQQPEVNAPADAPFVIHFSNGDAGTPHNIEIKDSTGASKFMGDTVNGVGAIDYQVPALPAGTYQFMCTIHTSMTGTLKVGS
jgi:plastocyanin